MRQNPPSHTTNAIHPGAPKGKTWGPEAKFDLGELVILVCSIEAH